MSTLSCSEDVCGLKIISHKYKFLFFEVPKTGTSSLKELFINHADTEVIKNQFGFLDYPDYFRFAFIRNPWDRIVSCFLNKIKKDKSFNTKRFENGIMKKWQEFNVFYAGMPFDEFIYAVANIPDERAEHHFASQHTRLSMDGEIIMHQLYKFEDYQAEARRLMEKIGMDTSLELPHLNKTKKIKPYQEYYTPELAQLVTERYQKDIELFGYQFD